MSETFTFFWNGPFSNWFLRDIVIDDRVFNCCEQYYMYKKALHCGDLQTAIKIIDASDPKMQKRYGREVKSFIPDRWDSISRDIMFRANMAKYTQHDDLKKLLCGTEGMMAEASPYDKLWGIGLAEFIAASTPPRLWPGKNWLGLILTEIRDSICWRRV